MERSINLWDWVCLWLGADSEYLLPEGKGHDIRGRRPPESWELFEAPKLESGKFVWAPPPGAADVALEELRKARIKRQSSIHVFIVPRLFTMRWFKQLHKAADLVIEVPASTPFWDDSNFEPLIVALCFPIIRYPPWQIRGTPKMFAMERELRRVWDNPDLDGGDILRKLLQLVTKPQGVPEDVVPKLLLIGELSKIPGGNS
ncbi:hypothetical protein ACA910_001969 [Epithemia clementina (nom. ined.)]